MQEMTTRIDRIEDVMRYSLMEGISLSAEENCEAEILKEMRGIR